MHSNGKRSKTNSLDTTHWRKIFLSLRIGRRRSYAPGMYWHLHQHVGSFDKGTTNNFIPLPCQLHSWSHPAYVFTCLWIHRQHLYQSQHGNHSLCPTFVHYPHYCSDCLYSCSHLIWFKTQPMARYNWAWTVQSTLLFKFMQFTKQWIVGGWHWIG